MNSFVFTIGILFGLNIVLCPCEGTIFLPPEGDTFNVAPGSDVTIAWDYNYTKVDNPTFLNQNGVILAILTSFGDVTIETPGRQLGVDAAPPATLILKNVGPRHNGAYTFRIRIGRNLSDSSSVTVFVAVTPKVTTNCSSPFVVDEGGDVRCLCKAKDANPPGNVNVTWHNKDGKQIGDRKKGENLLSLIDVDKTDSGTYTCVAESLTLKNEISPNLIVNYPPEVTSFTSSPTIAIIGKKVTITCEANGHPEPSYNISHNGSDNVIAGKTYTTDVVNFSHAGLYQCVAKNRLGKDSKDYTLTVTSTVSTTTPKPTTESKIPESKTTGTPSKGATTKAPTTGPVQTTTVAIPSSNSSNKVATPTANVCQQVVSASVVVWHVIVSLLSGFIIGALLSCIVLTVYFRRRYRNRKSQPNLELQTTSKNEAIYQDLDLNKMNQEENYQFLRGEVNSGNKENESDYTDLNFARDVKDNYQSLTST